MPKGRIPAGHASKGRGSQVGGPCMYRYLKCLPTCTGPSATYHSNTAAPCNQFERLSVGSELFNGKGNVISLSLSFPMYIYIYIFCFCWSLRNALKARSVAVEFLKPHQVHLPLPQDFLKIGSWAFSAHYL